MELAKVSDYYVSDQGLLLLLIPVFRVLFIQISNLRQTQDINLNWFILN